MPTPSICMHVYFNLTCVSVVCNLLFWDANTTVKVPNILTSVKTFPQLAARIKVSTLRQSKQYILAHVTQFCKPLKSVELADSTNMEPVSAKGFHRYFKVTHECNIRLTRMQWCISRHQARWPGVVYFYSRVQSACLSILNRRPDIRPQHIETEFCMCRQQSRRSRAFSISNSELIWNRPRMLTLSMAFNFNVQIRQDSRSVYTLSDVNYGWRVRSAKFADDQLVNIVAEDVYNRQSKPGSMQISLLNRDLDIALKVKLNDKHLYRNSSYRCNMVPLEHDSLELLGRETNKWQTIDILPILAIYMCLCIAESLIETWKDYWRTISNLCNIVLCHAVSDMWLQCVVMTSTAQIINWAHQHSRSYLIAVKQEWEVLNIISGIATEIHSWCWAARYCFVRCKIFIRVIRANWMELNGHPEWFDSLRTFNYWHARQST